MFEIDYVSNQPIWELSDEELICALSEYAGMMTGFIQILAKYSSSSSKRTTCVVQQAYQQWTNMHSQIQPYIVCASLRGLINGDSDLYSELNAAYGERCGYMPFSAEMIYNLKQITRTGT